MHPFFEKLNDQQDVDTITPLEILYNYYIEFYAVYSEVIREKFQVLNTLTESLSFQEQNAISDTLCDICSEYEKAAFAEGVRLGAQLAAELES